MRKRDLLAVLVLSAALSYQPPSAPPPPVPVTQGGSVSTGLSEEARWLLGVVQATYTP